MNKILLHDSLGFGLIINLPTGILVSNQTGGTACLQPEIEGIFIPIANDIFIESNTLHSPETELTQYFSSPKHAGTGACNGIDLKDVEVIECILEKYNLQNFITVDITKLSESHESWIWVKINANSENNLFLKNFDNSDLSGVITWCNSD